MSVYCYTARNTEGRFVHGSVEASSVEEALDALRGRTLFVSSVEAAASARGFVTRLIPSGRVSPQSIAVLLRSLATMVRAGISMRRALAITIEQFPGGRLKETLKALLDDVEGGYALSDAMRRNAAFLPQPFIAAIAAGEQSGAVDDVLDRLASGAERDRAVRRKLAAALTYPIIVLATAIGVVGLLLTTTIPVFRQMYAQLHASVPPILDAASSAATLFASWKAPAVMICALISAAVLGRRYREEPAIAAAIERIALGAPIVGTTVRKARLALAARTLGDLLHAGVNIQEALAVTAKAVPGTRLRAMLELARSEISSGSSLADPLAASGMCEPLFIQLVRVGEESASLDAMLARIAAHYDAEVESALQALGSALEPVLILFLGGVVAAIAAAVFIPLYSLIGSIK